MSRETKIVIAILGGCAALIAAGIIVAITPTPAKFKLVNGQVIACKNWHIFQCGLTLEDCDDGTNHYCVTGAAELK